MPVAPTGQLSPQAIGLWVGETVGCLVGERVMVGATEMDGASVGETDNVGSSDFVGLAVGKASMKVIGSLIRSTAHHMIPRKHSAKAY